MGKSASKQELYLVPNAILGDEKALRLDLYHMNQQHQLRFFESKRLDWHDATRAITFLEECLCCGGFPSFNPLIVHTLRHPQDDSVSPRITPTINDLFYLLITHLGQMLDVNRRAARFAITTIDIVSFEVTRYIRDSSTMSRLRLASIDLAEPLVVYIFLDTRERVWFFQHYARLLPAGAFGPFEPNVLEEFTVLSKHRKALDYLVREEPVPTLGPAELFPMASILLPEGVKFRPARILPEDKAS